MAAFLQPEEVGGEGNLLNFTLFDIPASLSPCRRSAEYLRRLRVGHPAAVQEAVDAQGGSARKRFATALADEGFLSRVENQVLLQVPLQAVAFVTVRTAEGTLAAVTHLQRRAAFCEKDRD